MDKNEKIFIAGHTGMVGSAVYRLLREHGYDSLVTRSHQELDLTDQRQVHAFFTGEKIERVVLAAARVGGIHANNIYPADFIYQNLMIQTNVIHEAFRAGVEHLLFLGSSCIYPKFAPQPMKEEHLLTGLLEPTNEPYALAKIAGIKMCESYNRQYGTSYRSVMPTNLYGPGDNYHLENSHVIPAMLRKYHLAKLAKEGRLQDIQADEAVFGKIPRDICDAIGYLPETGKLRSNREVKVVLWGTGEPCREFLHVDDMAAACLFTMKLDQSHFAGSKPSFLNIGFGEDIKIKEAAHIIAELTGFIGETVFDDQKPDGTPRKLLDSKRINELGWTPRFSLEEGVKIAYDAYKKQINGKISKS